MCDSKQTDTHFPHFTLFWVIIIEYQTNLLSFLIMSNLIQFTEAELETIAAAMDDYIHYDDENANDDDLIGGLSVNDRVYSINQKINNFFANRGAK